MVTCNKHENITLIKRRKAMYYVISSALKTRSKISGDSMDEWLVGMERRKRRE